MGKDAIFLQLHRSKLKLLRIKLVFISILSCLVYIRRKVAVVLPLPHKPRNKHSFRDVTCCQLQVRVTWRAGADAWSSAHISRLSRFVFRGRWMLWPIKYIIDVSVSVTSHIRIERAAAMGDSLKSESFIMHDLK